MKFTHDLIERKSALLIVLVILTVSVGGMVEIVPLFFQRSTTQPIAGLKPYTALQLAGRDIYVREGCYNCHSQMIRPFRSETERYGHYSVAGESVYDRPFQWGSKRTGPDLARVGGRYGDEWHRIHLHNPRDLVPESNMPAYPWLETSAADDSHIVDKLTVLRSLGHPYTDADIAGAKGELAGKTEQDALIAYLQSLGIALKERQMNFDMNTVRELVTVVSFLAFVGILAWVAASRNAAGFEEASRIPFEEDDGR